MLNLLYYDFLAVFKKLWYYVLIITGLAFVVRILWSEAFLTLFDNSNFFIGLVIRYVALGFLCAFGVLIVVIAIMVQAQWFDEIYCRHKVSLLICTCFKCPACYEQGYKFIYLGIYTFPCGSRCVLCILRGYRCFQGYG